MLSVHFKAKLTSVNSILEIINDPVPMLIQRLSRLPVSLSEV